MKKIIFIGHEPLTERIKSIFHFEEFINKGFYLEYWNLSQYFYCGYKVKCKLKNIHEIEINNLNDFRNQLSKEKVKNTIFIIEVLPIVKGIFIFKELNKQNAYCVKIDMFANVNIQLSSKKKILIRKFNAIKHIIDNIKIRILERCFKIKKYDLILSSSMFSSNTIRINHPDYEEYINTMSIKADNNYILFLDEYFPLHPDLIFINSQKGLSVEKYRKSLCHFFDIIEEKYQLSVIIAAHPKSDYLGNEFGNRKIVKNNTAKLVRQSALVVLHISSSISYAILNDKPIIICVNNEYKKSKESYIFQKYLAAYFNKSIIDLDNERDLYCIDDKKIDKIVREKYINTYLTSDETRNKSNIEIILGTLVKL